MRFTNEPEWTIGIEEEYFLIDPETRKPVPQPKPLLQKIRDLNYGQASPELFNSQIEIGTTVCENFQQARAEIGLLRIAVQEAAAEHGLKPIAVATHPNAPVHQQQITDKSRYKWLDDTLQHIARTALICGLHVHVGISNPDLRIHLMNHIKPHLPLLLALSASSPFWEGTQTGLASYRTTLIQQMPRTGLPPNFKNWDDYQHHTQKLVDTQILRDGTALWWAIRPSVRYPTLELRVTDLPTRMEDSITLAALYVSILRDLWEQTQTGQTPPEPQPDFLTSENIWRAQRYGTEGTLADYENKQLTPITHQTKQLLNRIQPHAEKLNCLQETQHAQTVADHGNGATHQTRTYQQAINNGATPQEASDTVLDYLLTQTFAEPTTTHQHTFASQ